MARYNVHGGHNRHVPGIISYLDEVTEIGRFQKSYRDFSAQKDILCMIVRMILQEHRTEILATL